MANKVKPAADGDAGAFEVDAGAVARMHAHRISVYDRVKASSAKAVSSDEITILLPNGSERKGVAGATTPLEVAAALSKSLAQRALVARLDKSVMWDLNRPLEKSCALEILDFERPEDGANAKKVFWHSSAHILGLACERLFNAKLCVGPPIDDGGFYYEMKITKKISLDSKSDSESNSESNSESDSEGDSESDSEGDSESDSESEAEGVKKVTKENKVLQAVSVTPEMLKAIDKEVEKIISEKLAFERLVIKKEDLLEMFKDNEFKVHLIQHKIPDGESGTVYRCGEFIDLCRGPHVPHTGYIRAASMLKASGSYFLGDKNNEQLQRIYGISFPSKAMLEEHKRLLAEAAKRDHRRIGVDQQLFFFHETSPGSCFFLPAGAHIYNTLLEMQREQYRVRGFQEVITPNIYNKCLWETSGHWAKYQNNMFSFDVESDEYALKPMNCPGHCVMFAQRSRSYNELPLRLADFGVLHRNEFSGALTGLTRVRRFQQDDAHIFCMLDQVGAEIENCIDFLKHTYAVFGFEFTMKLSTRPETDYIGAIAVWDNAEEMLKKALNQSGFKWSINPGDGAFYGPKIDVTIRDALKREHQCATIQLDFQLPERFKLTYRTSFNKNSELNKGVEDKCEYERPVMIHRAVFGSLERMIAILTEHFGGKWPFWLSPRQIIVVPVGKAFNKYAEDTRNKLHDAGFCAECDLGDATLKKKIYEAEKQQFNFIAVVGQQEETEGSVNLRFRDLQDSKKKNSSSVPLNELIPRLIELKKARSLTTQALDNLIN